MQIINLYPGAMASNCYLLVSGTHAICVDPSAPAKTILQAAQKEGATLEKILLTHGHFDHLLCLDELCEATGLEASIHENDLDLPGNAEKNAYAVFFGENLVFRQPKNILHDKDEIKLGNECIRVIHTPGHTAGSCCFLCGEDQMLTGDTVFSKGCGRTDLFGSSYEALKHSLALLQSYPKTVRIYPGHGLTALLGDALKVLSLN